MAWDINRINVMLDPKAAIPGLRLWRTACIQEIPWQNITELEFFLELPGLQLETDEAIFIFGTIAARKEIQSYTTAADIHSRFWKRVLDGPGSLLKDRQRGPVEVLRQCLDGESHLNALEHCARWILGNMVSMKDSERETIGTLWECKARAIMGKMKNGKMENDGMENDAAAIRDLGCRMAIRLSESPEKRRDLIWKGTLSAGRQETPENGTAKCFAEPCPLWTVILQEEQERCPENADWLREKWIAGLMSPEPDFPQPLAWWGLSVIGAGKYENFLLDRLRTRLTSEGVKFNNSPGKQSEGGNQRQEWNPAGTSIHKAAEHIGDPAGTGGDEMQIQQWKFLLRSEKWPEGEFHLLPHVMTAMDNPMLWKACRTWRPRCPQVTHHLVKKWVDCLNLNLPEGMEAEKKHVWEALSDLALPNEVLFQLINTFLPDENHPGVLEMVADIVEKRMPGNGNDNGNNGERAKLFLWIMDWLQGSYPLKRQRMKREALIRIAFRVLPGNTSPESMEILRQHMGSMGLAVSEGLDRLKTMTGQTRRERESRNPPDNLMNRECLLEKVWIDLGDSMSPWSRIESLNAMQVMTTGSEKTGTDGHRVEAVFKRIQEEKNRGVRIKAIVTGQHLAHQTGGNQILMWWKSICECEQHVPVQEAGTLRLIRKIFLIGEIEGLMKRQETLFPPETGCPDPDENSSPTGMDETAWRQGLRRLIHVFQDPEVNRDEKPPWPAEDHGNITKWRQTEEIWMEWVEKCLASVPGGREEIRSEEVRNIGMKTFLPDHCIDRGSGYSRERRFTEKNPPVENRSLSVFTGETKADEGQKTFIFSAREVPKLAESGR